MTQNAIRSDGAEGDGGTDDVVARAAQRSLAARQASYEAEVRKLLDAGMEVMRRAGTSSSPRVADIVREAGLSNDAFYRHFASKEDLVSAIVEAGSRRLHGYLAHQMGKESEPAAKVRRWIEGAMSQAGDPEVAHATRAVLWNGGRISDRFRSEDATGYGPLAALLEEPLAALGSPDPRRDAGAVCHAVMGRMNEFLWRREAPSPQDVDHLVAFALAAVSR